MLKRVAILALGCLISAISQVHSDDDEPVREALQKLNAFIGEWRGSGRLDTDRLRSWPENAVWTWKFKGRDCWLELTIEDGKFFKGGRLTYLPDDEKYQFAARDADGRETVFDGELKNGRLILQSTDPKTKEAQQIQMNSAGGGIRMVYNYSVKPANRTLFNNVFRVDFTKKGETFGTAEKQIECIVTGGLGTMPVTYMGNTYYVCCTGCRDAFNENPERILAEYRKKKGKRQ